MTPAEFVNAQIGKPWRAGAAGPDEWDCWSLTRAVQSVLFGRVLPVFTGDASNPREVIRAIRNSPLRQSWREVETPEHGDIITCARNDESHVGVYLDVDRGGVLHATEQGGVMFDALYQLPLKGFACAKFYRHGG